ncbi:hypothetical protein BJX66DRAFT_284261 [Aspergillus keveii]|uniref:Uncharacterized protein n=1 Tax=Aspergillus keveii TaxID=714993 RepID=A0ABR4FW32_9EURO
MANDAGELRRSVCQFSTSWSPATPVSGSSGGEMSGSCSLVPAVGSASPSPNEHPWAKLTDEPSENLSMAGPSCRLLGRRHKAQVKGLTDTVQPFLLILDLDFCLNLILMQFSYVPSGIRNLTLAISTAPTSKEDASTQPQFNVALGDFEISKLEC